MVLARFIPPNAIPIPHPLPQWHDFPKSTPKTSEEGALILAPISGYAWRLTCLSPGIDLYLPPLFMFPETEILFYAAEMAHRAHINLFASMPDGSNPVVVSIEEVDQLPFRRAVIRSAAGEKRTVVPLTVGPFGLDFEPFRSFLMQKLPTVFPAGMRWTKHEPSHMPIQLLSPREVACSLRNRLCSYDDAQRSLFSQFKIGVVSTKPGDMQTGNDRAIFQTKEASADFEEFLSFLGERVQLRGYEGFAGGLDTENDRTGVDTLRTSFSSLRQQYEVLFHVSTMLPYNEGDEQQLARKRHIGNDVVVVVFHQDDQPFDPRVFKSKFNQVFLVVKKVGVSPENGFPMYLLGLTCKEATPPCFPLLPQNSVFVAGPNFHRFLVSKIINAEAVTMRHSPMFSVRLARARHDLLSDIITSYSDSSAKSC